MTTIELINLTKDLLINGGETCFFCDAKLVENRTLSNQEFQALKESFTHWNFFGSVIGKRKICTGCYDTIRRIK